LQTGDFMVYSAPYDRFVRSWVTTYHRIALR